MIKAYNFIGSWQLFPEKGIYEFGDRPKSGIYKIEGAENKNQINVSINWVSLENEAFNSSYTLSGEEDQFRFDEPALANFTKTCFSDALNFEISFIKNEQVVLKVHNELLPNGYLKTVLSGTMPDGNAYTNTEIYHKQLSVMPYSTSVSGAVIKPNEAGVIRHKALTAMEEQTNMQLSQIRRQIELLAIQAQEIQMRKELSMLIYNARLSFVPVIGHTYYLYQKSDDTHILSMISAKEFGGGFGPYKKFIAPVKLLADHTWVEL
jgi:hypothetical protein